MSSPRSIRYQQGYLPQKYHCGWYCSHDNCSEAIVESRSEDQALQRFTPTEHLVHGTQCGSEADLWLNATHTFSAKTAKITLAAPFSRLKSVCQYASAKNDDICLLRHEVLYSISENFGQAIGELSSSDDFLQSEGAKIGSIFAFWKSQWLRRSAQPPSPNPN